MIACYPLRVLDVGWRQKHLMFLKTWHMDRESGEYLNAWEVATASRDGFAA